MDQASCREKRSEFVKLIEHLWRDSRPLSKLFRTEAKGYLYDTGTNRIFALGEIEFDLLNNLMKLDYDKAIEKTLASRTSDESINALDGIIRMIKEKNILKANKSIQFRGGDFRNMDEAIHNELGMLQLEATERCNLRCAYCIYEPSQKEKRNHGVKNMSLNTATMAIDHLKKSSGAKRDVAIAFYGGEPLLCFPFMKACVQYSRNALAGKELTFSITTNATLITPAIAKFLAQEKFTIHASVDGPQDIHDEYRKYAGGRGSFQRAISGLKMLFDTYADDYKRISLSMVYAPPYSVDKVNRASELWNLYPWLPKNIGLSVSYARGFSLPSENKQQYSQVDYSLMKWAKREFVACYHNENESHPIASTILEKDLARLSRRRIYEEPPAAYHLNGCCVPGARKQFVSVDGSLSICEKIGMAPRIGNVWTGVDVKALHKNYIEEYEKSSMPFCSQCWAIQLCSICYLHAFSEGEINLEVKKLNCEGMRRNMVGFLSLYCGLLESKKSGLEYLKSWQLT